MRGTLAPLLAIVGASPGRFIDGLRGEVDESLTQELRALEAPVYPGTVAASFGDGRDTAAFLQLCGAVVAISILAEGGQQPRRDDFAGAGQGCVEVPVIGELCSDNGDLLIEAFHGLDGEA